MAKKVKRTSSSSAAADPPPMPPGPAPTVKSERVIALPWRADGPIWRDLFIALLVALAITVTIFIWTGDSFSQLTQGAISADSPATSLGKGPHSRHIAIANGVPAVLTGMVWAVAMVGLLGRMHARRTVRTLRAMIMHDEIFNARLQPEITESQTGLGMKHTSAWLTLALGLTATAILWQAKAIERHVAGFTPLIVGASITTMFALAVAACATNYRKSRRLARDLRTALNSERLALETIASLDVMISACLPTGERTRFNDWFLQFVGRTDAQMRGHGWLEAVHPNDREAAVELAARPLGPNEALREHDMCVRHANGNYVWLHETIVPRFNERGEVIEFICTAVNITAHVESANAFDKQIGELKVDLEKTQNELAEIKGELSKTKTSRNRFEKSLEESREEVKNLQSSLDKAESALEKAQIEAAERIKESQVEAKGRIKAIEESTESRIEKLEDALKTTKAEHQNAVAENKKLTRGFEKLQVEMAELRKEDGELREQIARHIKEGREFESQVSQAHAGEAQHRAKYDQLAQRCDELEKELERARKAAAQAGTDAAAEIERRIHEVSAEALAAQLRRQLDGLHRMTKEMQSYIVDGPAKEAVNNTAATVRAMSDLVDRTLGEVKDTRSETIARRAASFDLRRTASGVCELLAKGAKDRAVSLKLEVSPKIPALLHGDDVEIRTVLGSLTDAALQLASEGALIMRLTEDLSTAAHSTIRCELRYTGARVKPNGIETALAIKSTDQQMPDPVKQPMAHQAAKAWQIIRSLGGKHGYLLPDEGGFSVWFTFNLGRPGASVSVRETQAPPPKASHDSILSQVMDDEPPSTPLRSESPRPVQATKPHAPAVTRSPAPQPMKLDDKPLQPQEDDEPVIQPPVAVQAPSKPAAAIAAKPTPPAPAKPVAPAPVPAKAAPPAPAMPAPAPTKVEEPAAPTPSPAAAPVPGRQMPRMPQEFLNCNLGEVVELGGDSIRIICAKQPKPDKSGAVSVAFDDLEVDTAIELRGEVAWSKKLAARQFDVGIKFINLTPAQQRQLLQIAMQHRKTSAPPEMA